MAAKKRKKNRGSKGHRLNKILVRMRNLGPGNLSKMKALERLYIKVEDE
jgi:hypothetical protein